MIRDLRDERVECGWKVTEHGVADSGSGTPRLNRLVGYVVIEQSRILLSVHANEER